jgi:hypothetical protein
VAYLVCRGEEKETSYYPFEQFDLFYNRPDIINQRLGIGDDLYNSSLEEAHKRRLKKAGFDESQSEPHLDLPVVNVSTPSGNCNDLVKQIEFSAIDNRSILHKILIYNNDVAIFGTKGITVEGNLARIEKKIDVPLIPGENLITVSVLNKEGVESVRQKVKIYCSKEAKKSNLYVVAVGVSEYNDKNFNPMPTLQFTQRYSQTKRSQKNALKK